MRVLITGAGGMLGRDVEKFFRDSGDEVLATARQSANGALPLDVCDPRATRELIRDCYPDVVVHCAANTNVDGCERDPDSAYRDNALGVWSVASAAEQIGATLVVISTDFVFDGALSRPYTEYDEPNPLNVYGASKLAGERLALQHCRRTYVVRTSWLFGVYGRNFVYTIAKRAKENRELHVVADQYGTPTYTADLAAFLPALLNTNLYGLYHVNNAGSATWFEFAVAIVERLGLDDVAFHPLSSEECAVRFNTPTHRPKNSVLRRYNLELLGIDTMRPWENALDAFIADARRAGTI